MLLCIIQLILVVPLVFGLYMGRLSLLEGYPEKDKLDEAEGLDDMYRAVEQLNTVLDLEFLVSREPYQKTPEFERFSDSLIHLLIPLQTIDQYFKDALWCQEVLRTKNTGELKRVELFAAAINVNYETETPLDKISSVVNENFFKQLQEFGNTCVTNMSQLQLITRLYQNIQWASAKFRMTTEIVYDYLESYQMLSTNDLDAARERFSSPKISNLYYDLTIKFKDKIRNMSRAVYACRGPLSTFDDTLSELRVFRTIFARFCSEERKNVANYHSKLNCSSMRHPIPNCDDSPREQNCTIWQTCEGSISCGDLKEDTTVCLGKDHDDGHMYEWYAPSKEFKESTCALFHPFRKWEKVDSRVSAPLLLSVTKLERICLSCQCVCNERTYYVSTEVTETDWQKSMVVVGARLAISNDTLFLEVQQGRVSKSGTIYTNDTKWLTPTIGHREKISLETRVAFNLTRVALPQGRVLTGLGLVQRMVDRTSVIGIRVSSQVYNSALGELLSTTAAALNKSVSDQSEPEHKNGKSSSHVTQSPPLHSGLGTYVELTVSDGLDGGRSSIPYIDTQKVIPNPLTPLAGAGLYWKEGGISGGFIGVELLTYNILPFLHETSRESDL